MSDTVDATGYLIVEGERPRYYADSPVRAAKISGVRAKKPASLTRDQVAVKVTIRMPKSAFEAFSPEAVLEVPEEMVQQPIVVEAETPDPS